MVATQNIKASELILYDNALALGPKFSSSLLCLQCVKKLPKDHDYLCTRCKWPLCGPKCESGKTHQRECAILARHPDTAQAGIQCMDQYRCITPLRLLLNKQSERFKTTIPLMDHNEERKKYTDLWNNQKKYVNEYLKKCQLDFTDEEYDRAVGLLWTNSLSCRDSEGMAIFPIFSIVSHSCSPNASNVMIQSQQVALEAKLDIKKGEEITIAYTSVVQGRVKRRKKLREKWFFDCCCPRCSDPTEFGSHVSTLKCDNESCSGLVLPKSPEGEDQICSSCGYLITAKAIDKLENEAALDIQKSLDAPLHQMKALVKKWSLKFHERHYLVILVKKHIVAMFDDLSSLSKEELKERLKLCEEVLIVYNIINPGRNTDRGKALRQKAETKKMLLKKMKMADEISDTEFTTQVSKCVAILSESQECMAMLVRKI